VLVDFSVDEAGGALGETGALDEEGGGGGNGRRVAINAGSSLPIGPVEVIKYRRCSVERPTVSDCLATFSVRQAGRVSGRSAIRESCLSGSRR
jgi:hypothetical protein